MARNDFNTHISLAFVEKILEFCHIVKHESILSELHFNQNLAFHEIYLLECTWN